LDVSAGSRVKPWNSTVATLIFRGVRASDAAPV